jgi:hypothetical protein
VLVINPRQIFIKTQHDNPYPDFLYWFTDIDTAQYRMILDHMIPPDKTRFADSTNIYSDYYLLYFEVFVKEASLPAHWSDKEISKHSMDYRKKLYTNLCALIRTFNVILASNVNEIKVPDQKEFIRIKPVRIVYFMEQFDDQLNTIIYK